LERSYTTSTESIKERGRENKIMTESEIVFVIWIAIAVTVTIMVSNIMGLEREETMAMSLIAILSIALAAKGLFGN